MLNCFFTLDFFAKRIILCLVLTCRVFFGIFFDAVLCLYGILGHAMLFRFMCFVMCFLYCRTILGLLRGIVAAERYSELFSLG